MSVINLDIPGDSGGLHDLADWLDDTLVSAIEDVEDAIGSTIYESAWAWSGKSGEAFRDFLYEARSGFRDARTFPGSLAEVFRAYAQRLVRGRDTFADYADEARRSWLIVSGNEITVPPRPTVYLLPQGATPPPDVYYLPSGEAVERPPGGYDESVRVFNRIAEDVGKWWGELEVWLDEHMGKLFAAVNDLERLTVFLNRLKQGDEFVASYLLTYSEGTWRQSLDSYRARAKEAQAEYDSHSKRLRSGNPAVRAGAEKITKGELRAIRNFLDGEVKALRVGTKIIPGVGLALDLASLGVDVSQGGSLSSGVVGLGGAAAGGAAAAGVLSGPPGWVALGVVAIAAGVGWGAERTWEAAVPLDVREALDNGDWEYLGK